MLAIDAARGRRALADGSDIFLGAGEKAHDPELMGHEVAHVAQSKKGAASGPHGKREGDVSAIELDADRAGAELAHAAGPVMVAASASGVRLKPGDKTPPAGPVKNAAAQVRTVLRKLAFEASAVVIEINAAADQQYRAVNDKKAYEETTPARWPRCCGPCRSSRR